MDAPYPHTHLCPDCHHHVACLLDCTIAPDGGPHGPPTPCDACLGGALARRLGGYAPRARLTDQDLADLAALTARLGPERFETLDFGGDQQLVLPRDAGGSLGHYIANCTDERRTLHAGLIAAGLNALPGLLDELAERRRRDAAPAACPAPDDPNPAEWIARVRALEAHGACVARLTELDDELRLHANHGVLLPAFVALVVVAIFDVAAARTKVADLAARPDAPAVVPIRTDLLRTLVDFYCAAACAGMLTGGPYDMAARRALWLASHAGHDQVRRELPGHFTVLRAQLAAPASVTRPGNTVRTANLLQAIEACEALLRAEVP